MPTDDLAAILIPALGLLIGGGLTALTLWRTTRRDALSQAPAAPPQRSRMPHLDAVGLPLLQHFNASPCDVGALRSRGDGYRLLSWLSEHDEEILAASLPSLHQEEVHIALGSGALGTIHILLFAPRPPQLHPALSLGDRSHIVWRSEPQPVGFHHMPEAEERGAGLLTALLAPELGAALTRADHLTDALDASRVYPTDLRLFEHTIILYTGILRPPLELTSPELVERLIPIVEALREAAQPSCWASFDALRSPKDIAQKLLPTAPDDPELIRTIVSHLTDQPELLEAQAEARAARGDTLLRTRMRSGIIQQSRAGLTMVEAAPEEGALSIATPEGALSPADHDNARDD